MPAEPDAKKDSHTGGWPQILATYAFGVLAGAMILRPVPLEGDLIEHFQFTGLQFSLFLGIAGLPAAILATSSGIFVDRFGARSALMLAAFAGILLDLTYLVAPDIITLFILRFLEGIVIVTTLNAGPALIIAMTADRRQSSALSLWSSYTPIGNFVALAIGGAVAGSGFWTFSYGYHAGLLLLTAILAHFSFKKLKFSNQSKTRARQGWREILSVLKQPGPVRLAIIFFAIASLGIGSTTVLPGYIAAEHGLSINEASGLMAGANLMMLAGTFLTGVAVTRGIKLMLLTSILVAVGILLGVTVFYPGLPFLWLTPILGGWFIGLGAGKVLMTILIPLATTEAQRGLSMGVVNQAAALASFGAPVIWKLLANGSSWIIFAVMVCGSWIAVYYLVRKILHSPVAGEN